MFSYALVCSVHAVLLPSLSQEEIHANAGRRIPRDAFTVRTQCTRGVDYTFSTVPSPGPDRRLLSGSWARLPPYSALPLRRLRP